MNRFFFALHLKTKCQHSCMDCIATHSPGKQLGEALGIAAGHRVKRKGEVDSGYPVNLCPIRYG